MPTAGDLRAAAWKRMKEGGLLPLLAGFALVMLLVQLAGSAVFRFGIEFHWIESLPALEFAKRAGMVLAPEHEEVLAPLSVPLVRPAYLPVFILVDGIWEYGILAFGGAVLAVSATRGAATAFLVLSGFRWPLLLRTAALGVLRALIVFLGSLLLVIPGLVALYSCRMAFYLLADNPDWSPWRALQESKRLMYGHRWRLVCLDASFLGWALLVFATRGLAGIFVLPYFAMANAAFYEDLLDRTGR